MNQEFQLQLMQREGLGGLLTGGKFATLNAEATNLWTGVKYKAKLINGQWTRIAGVSYLTDWLINVYDDNGVCVVGNIRNIYKDKTVGINLATGALGDTLCWTGSALKFHQKESLKKTYVATSWSHIFDTSKYPTNFEFTLRTPMNENRSYPEDCDIWHLLGITRDHKTRSSPELNHAGPTDWSVTNMADTENYALGVETGAIKPFLKPLNLKRLHTKPYVTICSYTTQKIKHLLSNECWMAIIRHIKSFGFDVINVGNQFTTFPEIIEGCDPNIEVSMQYIRDAEFHVGLSSGLSWMAWAYNKQVLMINNFTHEGYEFIEGNTRILNNSVSYGHFNNPAIEWLPTWQFDPDNDGHKQSCRSITPAMILAGFDELMRKRAIGSMEGTYLDVKDGMKFKKIKPLQPDWIPLNYTRDEEGNVFLKGDNR